MNLRSITTLGLATTTLAVALTTSACASSPEQHTDPQATTTQSSDTGALIPPAERVQLQEKFCRATLDYLAKQSTRPVPSTCENVILRTTERFGEGDNKGYLVTVVLGAEREKIDLGALVYPDGTVHLRSLKSDIERAHTQQAELQIRAVQNKVDQYYLHSTPKGLPESLLDLVTANIAAQIPVDPWGTPYVYRKKSATDYDIFSAGPDKQPDTLDDVRLE